MKINVKSLLQGVFFIGLFVSSVIFLPGPLGYELPRVAFVKLWITVLLVLGLFWGRGHLKTKKLDGALLTAIISFLVLVILTSLAGENVRRSFAGSTYRDDGIFTLLHLAGLSFFLTLFWEKSWEKMLVLTLAASSVANVFIALYLSRGSFGHSAFLSGYLLVTTPFVILQIQREDNLLGKSVWIVALGANILVLVTIGTMGGLLGLLVLGASFLLHKKKVSISKIAFILLTLSIFGGIALFIIKSNGPFTFESRNRIIARGILASASKPLTGWGWGNFDLAFDSTPWPMRYDHDVFVDKAHSALLEVLVTAGIFTLLSYLALIGRALYRLATDKRFPFYVFLSFLLYIVHAQTNVISVSEDLIFWIILGVVVATTPHRYN